MTRKQKILTSVFVAILFVALIGVTYAFFTATVTNNATSVSVTTTQLANLTMTSMKSETGTPVYPGWVGWQGIDVQATGSGKAVYDLTLNITGGSNIKNDVQIEVCKIEDTQTALAANQVTFTAATPTVSNNQYYMTGGVVTLPTGCTTVKSASTLTSLGSSVVISETGGKELDSGKRDRYYIKITYVNNPSAAQTQGQTFTITPSISTKAEKDTPVIMCETVASSGNYIACDTNNMYVGERVKIGNDANAQYFRYIRTTDTTSQLNECGTTSSVACADTATSTINIAGSGYIRLLAEYNLVATNYAVANTALQATSSEGNNVVSYDTTNYALSNVKSYVDNYANLLNSTYGITTSGSLITKAELVDLGCSTTAVCTNTYPWISNTFYWTGSTSSSRKVWAIVDSVLGDAIAGDPDYDIGVRPVIQIAVSAF